MLEKDVSLKVEEGSRESMRKEARKRLMSAWDEWTSVRLEKAEREKREKEEQEVRTMRFFPFRYLT